MVPRTLSLSPMPSATGAHERQHIALAIAIAAAPPAIALPWLFLVNRYDIVTSLTYAMLVSWFIATALSRATTSWSMMTRTAFGSVVLVATYVVSAMIAEILYGAATDPTFTQHHFGLKDLGAALLTFAIVLLASTLVALLFGTWIMLPLLPWMTVLRRSRLLATDDVREAVLFVSGASAIVESAVLGFARWPLALPMLVTAAAGGIAVITALAGWKFRLQELRTNQKIDPNLDAFTKRIPIRLSNVSDASAYDMALAPTTSTTYRVAADTLTVFVPSDARLTLGTLLWSWLSPTEPRELRVFAILQLVLAACSCLAYAAYYYVAR